MSDLNQHIENSLDPFRQMFKATSERIELMAKGEKIPATELAKEVADKLNLNHVILYQIIKYVLKDYPGIKITRGRYGGVEKL